MQNNKEKIEHIWSESFWLAEASRIELEYYDLIKVKLPKAKSCPAYGPSEHRIEDFVRKLSSTLEIPNLHVGLTSSDLEDNIRIKRLESSLDVVRSLLSDFVARYLGSRARFEVLPLIAYTHLMPAGTTNLWNRLAPTLHALKSCLIHIEDGRLIQYRGIRGALGDGHIQKKLGLPLGVINSRIFPGKDLQTCSSQTVDHMSDMDVAQGIVRIASLLAKFSNDIRMMFALGQAKHVHQDIGSTAIAAKAPNPWRYERVSGMAEQLYDTDAKVARVAANCLLERTLTNQSVLNDVFQHAFIVLVGMLEDLLIAGKTVKILDQAKQCKAKELHSEEEMLKLILKGIPRLEAHRKINKKYAR
jgi:adenylosuccinate lyase